MPRDSGSILLELLIAMAVASIILMGAFNWWADSVKWSMQTESTLYQNQAILTWWGILQHASQHSKWVLCNDPQLVKSSFLVHPKKIQYGFSSQKIMPVFPSLQQSGKAKAIAGSEALVFHGLATAPEKASWQASFLDAPSTENIKAKTLLVIGNCHQWVLDQVKSVSRRGAVMHIKLSVMLPKIKPPLWLAAYQYQAFYLAQGGIFLQTINGSRHQVLAGLERWQLKKENQTFEITLMGHHKEWSWKV